MFYLALRHLIERRRQTLFSFLGVLIATTAYIVIQSFFLGFQEYLIEQLINNDAHVRISARQEFLETHSLDRYFYGPDQDFVIWSIPPSGQKIDSGIENPIGWYRRLDADPRVIAYSSQLTAKILIARGGVSANSNLVGSIPASQEKVTNIADYMVQGKFSDIGIGGGRIIVGDDLLHKIGSRVGETVLVTVGTGAPAPFKVVGAFHIGIRTLDEGSAFAHLNDVQKVNGTPGEVNSIAVKVNDVSLAQIIARTWSLISSEKVQSWDEANANILNVFVIQNAVRYVTVFIIVIVASFGVYNILNMVVSQKKRDIAILRSMGFDQSEIEFLFLVQGILVGLAGGTVGLVLGYLFCRILETISFGGSPMGGGSGHLMVSFNPNIYIVGFLVSVVASTLAAFMPARSAGKMTPIDIIRSGGE